jgi:peroxisomal membrane protein 4
MEAVNTIIASKDYHDILSIIKGFRNGAVYGAKIRFPHALVMTLLFRRGE